MKSLAYLVVDSGVGGAEKMLTETLRRLDPTRFNVKKIFVLREKREMAAVWESMGIPVQAFHMGMVPSPWLLWKCNQEIKKVRPDLLHAFLYLAIMAARVIRLFNKSFLLVSSPHTNYRFASWLMKWVDRLLKSQDTLTMSESKDSQQFLLQNLGYDQERVHLVLNGIDMDAYQFNRRDRDRIRSELNLSPDDFLVGSVGRLHPVKSYRTFIDALAELGKDGKKIAAVLVGTGPEEAMLKQQARKKNVALTLLGHREDVAALLSAFDCFVQSSKHEGLSIALLETMSVGVPIVATVVGGTLDVARNGENALLIPPQDSTALAAAIEKVMSNTTLAQSLGQQGRETVKAYSVIRMVQDIEKSYESCTK